LISLRFGGIGRKHLGEVVRTLKVFFFEDPELLLLIVEVALQAFKLLLVVDMPVVAGLQLTAKLIVHFCLLVLLGCVNAVADLLRSNSQIFYVFLCQLKLLPSLVKAQITNVLVQDSCSIIVAPFGSFVEDFLLVFFIM
jgi:hypothetical protein